VKVTPSWQSFIDEIKSSWFPYLIDADVTPKTPHPTTKRGLTKVLWVKHIENDKAVIDIEILTWRTHQIRVHLSERGLPIVGDYLYGEEGECMMLSAVKVVFKDIKWILMHSDYFNQWDKLSHMSYYWQTKNDY
jgi:hypothetical protein